jgi:ribosomal protein L14E/L6E/L27E
LILTTSCISLSLSSLKSGKVVIVLNGRFAGRKAVIVHNQDEGTADRKYGHAVVAGVARYPKRVTRSMNKKKIAIRSKVKTFVKVINYNHLMPTRYVLVFFVLFNSTNSRIYTQTRSVHNMGTFLYPTIAES